MGALLGCDCQVVKLSGNDIVARPIPPSTYEVAGRWINGRRYYGCYAIQDLNTGRLLSYVSAALKPADFVAGIRSYAQQHYLQGWDLVVECFSDSQLIEIIGDAQYDSVALNRVADVVAVSAARRREQVALVGW